MGEPDARPEPGPPGAPPPVVIVRHRKERRSKCTLEPLRGREGFVFLRYPDDPAPPLAGYVRLGLGAPPLGPSDRGAGLLLLDATWRLVEPMERAYTHVPARSLPALATAYPRRSKLFVDPTAGLASIEALYAALAILGRDTAGLLDGYAGATRFLAANRNALAGLGGACGVCDQQPGAPSPTLPTPAPLAPGAGVL